MAKFIKKSFGAILGSKVSFLLLRKSIKKKLIILCYHRVINKESEKDIRTGICVDRKEFEEQMKLLSNYYTPLSEGEIIAIRENNKQRPDYPVWVTFDDGYKDNYTYAYPILRKYDIPATIFVTPSFVDKCAFPWVDYVVNAIRNTKVNLLNCIIGDDRYRLYLRNEQEKTVAIRKLWKLGAGIFQEKHGRQKRIDNFIEQLQVKLGPNTLFKDELFLTWAEIKELINNRITIGSHGMTHRILSELTQKDIEQEILKSKTLIEKRIGVEIFSFAYPRGSKHDYNQKCIDVLKNSGFKIGVTAEKGFNSLKDTNYLCLKRIVMPFEDTLNIFRFKISQGILEFKLS